MIFCSVNVPIIIRLYTVITQEDITIHLSIITLVFFKGQKSTQFLLGDRKQTNKQISQNRKNMAK